MDLQKLNLRPVHREFVNRFVSACLADERVVAAFLGGSYAKGRADDFSDVDLCLITTDSAYEEFYRQRESFLGQLGELVFLEDFGVPNLALFIFADGTEGELNFGGEGRLDQIHSGPFHVLLDKKNILAGANFPETEIDPAKQVETLRQEMNGFWHELSHFITAMGRGQLWWAQGQLEALRSICVNLARLQNNFTDRGAGDEPYFKIENAMPVQSLAPLENTFHPMEKHAMLESAWILLRFYRELGRSLAQRQDVPYPSGLDRVMVERLEKLSSKPL